MENDNLHQEQARTRKQLEQERLEREEQAKQEVNLKELQIKNQLENSVSSVLDKFESDEREQELQELAAANPDLIDENNKLKKQIEELRQS